MAIPPGIVIAFIVSTVMVGAAAGFLWLFVYGDKSWPSISQTILGATFALAFLTLLAIIIYAGFRVGKREERSTRMNRTHILISISATLIPLGILVLHQLSVGNLGPESNSSRCINYCLALGYQGSGMTPRDSGEVFCSCYGDVGAEVKKIPMTHLGEP
jgi:hypothetical protein